MVEHLPFLPGEGFVQPGEEGEALRVDAVLLAHCHEEAVLDGLCEAKVVLDGRWDIPDEGFRSVMEKGVEAEVAGSPFGEGKGVLRHCDHAVALPYKAGDASQAGGNEGQGDVRWPQLLWVHKAGAVVEGHAWRSMRESQSRNRFVMRLLRAP